MCEHASPFPAMYEQCAARISPSVTLPQEPHFDGRLDSGLRMVTCFIRGSLPAACHEVVAANGLPSFELLSRYKTRPQDHKFANVGGIDERSQIHIHYAVACLPRARVHSG
ncbi:hypothetical protein HPB52_009365 [Rhipicephalus sanguineus]|uniref:Uncharacterized protein n=1 Tax=Rhipicephalus sanguineus TaxID=34632 RepID=A0A9D4SYL1_RHISA|nr:hypothetical protein HPB52_009365 [Rhipicephalus sanguineus]